MYFYFNFITECLQVSACYFKDVHVKNRLSADSDGRGLAIHTAPPSAGVKLWTLGIESLRRNNRRRTCHQSTAKVKAQSFTIILMAVASDIKRFACHFPPFSLTPTVTSWHVDVNVRYGDSLKTQIAMGRRITANWQAVPCSVCLKGL